MEETPVGLGPPISWEVMFSGPGADWCPEWTVNKQASLPVYGCEDLLYRHELKVHSTSLPQLLAGDKFCSRDELVDLGGSRCCKLQSNTAHYPISLSWLSLFLLPMC